MDRASPVDIRVALSTANVLARAGIDFVCVPVTDDADKDALMDDVNRRLEKMKTDAESSGE